MRGRKIAQELGLALPDTKRYTKKERKRKSVKEWRQKNKERLRAYKRAWMYAKRHDKARPHGNRSWPQAQTRSYASYLAEWREKNPKMTEARREEIRDRIAKETAKNRAC
ncbi:MAG: hypothetical protein U1D31_03390 [Patescibacteria group bacterium]|nr:hypothetical protein [Patescibacteria group bacterium]